MKQWVSVNQESSTCCWVEPVSKSKVQNPLWWARTNDNVEGEVPNLTLQDVADEVRVGLMLNHMNSKKPDWPNYNLVAFDEPYGHRHLGKDGLGYLTGGLSQWENR